ncbi:MAG: hypothetical protein WBP90_18005 [Terracidiphilus sp.]
MQTQPAATPAAAFPVSAAPATAPATPFAVPAPSAAQMGESLIANMSLGEKIASAGAVAAILGYFMPWISIAGSPITYSGLALTESTGALALVVSTALASAVVCYLSIKATASKKLLYASYLTYFGALCGPAYLVALIFVPKVQSVAGIGAWMCALGFTAVAKGGLMTIKSFSKRTY